MESNAEESAHLLVNQLRELLQSIRSEVQTSGILQQDWVTNHSSPKPKMITDKLNEARTLTFTIQRQMRRDASLASEQQKADFETLASELRLLLSQVSGAYTQPPTPSRQVGMDFGEDCSQFITEPLKIICSIPNSVLERRSTEKKKPE